MEIQTDKFIKELATRTQKNYQFVKENCKKDGLNEVTQLINSMYCLLVVPEEVFGIKYCKTDERGRKASEFASYEKKLRKYESYRKIKEIIDDLKKNQKIKYSSIDSYTEESPVSCILYNMRNALCHDGLGFLPITNEKNKSEISEIIFRASSKDKTIFICVFTVEQLESFLYAVSDFYIDIEEGKAESDKKEYTNYYRKIAKELKENLPGYKNLQI